MFSFSGHDFDFSTSRISDLNRFTKANKDLQNRMARRKTGGSLQTIQGDLYRVVDEIFPGQDAARKIYGDEDDVAVMLKTYIELVKAIPADAQQRAAALVAEAEGIAVAAGGDDA